MSDLNNNFGNMDMNNNRENFNVNNMFNSPYNDNRMSEEEINNQKRDILYQFDRLEKKVDTLQDSVSKGKGIVAVLVFLGTIAAGILGYFQMK